MRNRQKWINTINLENVLKHNVGKIDYPISQVQKLGHDLVNQSVNSYIILYVDVVEVQRTTDVYTD